MSSSSSRSSSWSPSFGGGGGGGAYDGHGSPVPYRVGPLDYQPETKCYCNVKACQWISWSFKNPGMRYLKCQKARTDADCGFFRWVDLDYSDSAFFKQLLNDMRGAIWDLRKVVAQKDARLCANDTELKLMHKQLHDHMKLVEAKDMCMHDLEAKMKKKDRYIGMLVWMCVFLSVALIAIVFKVKLA
ncbi:hypothetical protein SORBI_3005G048200 [Sorghum bicolor]|uniref:Zinc finger GRF-type domain-containing protein n=1 Tax=Sorghum bicolor TaxID=4558 RepID=A0A1B6PQ75_SORBI|nr:hypothetical protein SORBI_3005G048200 [Sorghum bicolor]